jgi:hypothetical protein
MDKSGDKQDLAKHLSALVEEKGLVWVASQLNYRSEYSVRSWCTNRAKIPFSRQKDVQRLISKHMREVRAS